MTAGMLGRQVRHEFASLVRTPVTLILSIGFPLLFFVLLAALVGNEVVDERTGVRVVQYLAPGLATFGLTMATFSFLAYGFALAASRGVLKRQTGSPAPRWVLLGGRIGAALGLGVLAVALVVGVGVARYGLQLYDRSLPLLLATVVMAAVAFSALGLAVALLVGNPQTTLAVTNGVVLPLAFVSDVFSVDSAMPPWLERIAEVFPLVHVVALLREALAPGAAEGTWVVHVAVVVGWGTAGALVAGWLLRTRSVGMPVRAASAPTDRASAADRLPRRDGSPGPFPVLLDQVRHTVSVLWRDPGSVFFAVAFPVLLVAIIPTVNGGGSARLPGGGLLSTFYAATMAVYGAAVTAYVNMPEALAEDRERGVLKRARASPLPTGTLLGGRIVGALSVAVLTLAAVAVLAAALYRSPLPPAWPGALLTFLAAATCFAVLGLAVLSLVSSAQAVVGVCLGTLLPLSFISDIFVVGVSLPPLLDTVSWLFPLRHAARAMTDAVSADAGWGLSARHLAVLLAWTLAGAVVVALRFRWEPREGARRAPVEAAPVD